LYIEHALLRAGIGALLTASRPLWEQKLDPSGIGDMPAFSHIIGAGAALTRTGHSGFNALLLLDALQPTGVTTLQADPYGLIAALGALARINPGAVVQVLDTGSLERLGVSFSLSGQPSVGKTAMKVKITTDEGEVIKHEVAGGHLWVYPLGIGRAATVEVRAAGRGTTLGGKSRVKMTLEGGAAGLIFDARGRPLPLALDPRGRAAQMPLWISEITGDSLIAIPDDWLVDAAEEGDIDETMAERPTGMKSRGGRKSDKPVIQPKRGGRFGRRGKVEAVTDDMPEPDMELEEAAPAEGFQSELDELRGGR
jgi:hypothetical protein